MSFLAELKRRKVFRVAVVYALVAWALASAADLLFPALLLPDVVNRALVIILFMGFPIALVLAWAFELRPEGAAPDETDGEETATHSTPAGWNIPVVVGLLIAGLVVGVLLGRFVGPPDIEEDSVATAESLQLPLRLENYVDNRSHFVPHRLALSPDGTQIAYVGRNGDDFVLFLKPTDSAEPEIIPNSEGALSPFFSWDGNSLGFYARGELRRVSVSGGLPSKIAELPDFLYGASWGDDDFIVFSMGYGHPLYRVSSGGGVPEQLTEFAGNEVSHRLPTVLPGSEVVLYQANTSNRGVDIWAVSLDTGGRKKLGRGVTPRYADGKLLFLREGQGDEYRIWSAEFDPVSLELFGAEVALVTPGIEDFHVSASGSLLYVQASMEIRNELLEVDFSSGDSKLIIEGGYINSPRYSPGGRYLLFDIAETEGVRFRTRGAILPLDDLNARISLRDGIKGSIWAGEEQVAFGIYQQGVFSAPASFQKEPAKILELAGVGGPLQWLEDGLVYWRMNPQTQGDLYYHKFDGSGEITISDDESPNVGAQVSRDRRWIAYGQWVHGQSEIFVQSFPDGLYKRKVSTNGGETPRWSPDGSELCYVSYNKIMCVAVSGEETLSIGEPRVVFEGFNNKVHISHDQFDISPNGEKFVVVNSVYSEIPPQVYVTNWQEALLPD